MRMFLALVVGVAALGAVLKHRDRHAAPAGAASAAGTSAASSPVATATPHHWPKKAIDRAAELRQQVAKERAEIQSQ